MIGGAARLRRIPLLIVGIGAGLCMLAAVGAFAASKRVVGASMSPTLGDGDRILTDPFRSTPVRFDLVIVRLDGVESVKRLIGLPGDSVEIRVGSPPAILVRPAGGDQTLTVAAPGLADRWPATPEPCCTAAGTSSPAGVGPQVVPEGFYFLLGDNPRHSADSRRFGWIAEDEVAAVVRWRVWPPSGLGRPGGGYTLD